MAAPAPQLKINDYAQLIGKIEKEFTTTKAKEQVGSSSQVDFADVLDNAVKDVVSAEKQANQFAMATLFGESGIEPFDGLERDGDIRRVAQEVGISPGLAVFQMHRARLLDYNRGNKLCVDLRA